jgi:hypothetical protein
VAVTLQAQRRTNLTQCPGRPSAIFQGASGFEPGWRHLRKRSAKNRVLAMFERIVETLERAALRYSLAALSRG